MKSNSEGKSILSISTLAKVKLSQLILFKRIWKVSNFDISGEKLEFEVREKSNSNLTCFMRCNSLRANATVAIEAGKVIVSP